METLVFFPTRTSCQQHSCRTSKMLVFLTESTYNKDAIEAVNRLSNMAVCQAIQHR